MNSGSWRKKQKTDEFYTKAKSEGYRCRAAYKLIEMQEKFTLILPQSTILDLGCAPGGWLQVAKKYTQRAILGIDLQAIEPMTGVHFGHFDFTDQVRLQEFLSSVKASTKFDAILSDMSPPISGDREADHYGSIELARAVFEFSLEHLANNGYMVCKLFDGKDTNELLSEIKPHMTVKIFKPAASRSESRETFLVCCAKDSNKA